MSEGIIQTQRFLPFTPDEIYAAFADPVSLARWWGPQGFTNTFETFQFRQGGIWTFIMHGPGGTNFSNSCVFKDVDPGKKIVIRHTSPPHFTLSIILAPDSKGTQLLWVQAFDDPKVASAMRNICEPANEQNLDRLEVVLRSI